MIADLTQRVDRTYDPDPMPKNDLITTAEAAEILGVGAQRIRDLISSGRLPAKKFGEGRGGVWMIRRSDLEKVKERKPGRPSKHK